jgi:hypothetical protein
VAAAQTTVAPGCPLTPSMRTTGGASRPRPARTSSRTASHSLPSSSRARGSGQRCEGVAKLLGRPTAPAPPALRRTARRRRTQPCSARRRHRPRRSRLGRRDDRVRRDPQAQRDRGFQPRQPGPGARFHRPLRRPRLSRGGPVRRRSVRAQPARRATALPRPGRPVRHVRLGIPNRTPTITIDGPPSSA